jgi:hypothetical protein
MFCLRRQPSSNLLRDDAPGIAELCLEKRPMWEDMNRAITIALLDEIQDGFNRHDVQTILAHFTDDCE